MVVERTVKSIDVDLDEINQRVAQEIYGLRLILIPEECSPLATGSYHTHDGVYYQNVWYATNKPSFDPENADESEYLQDYITNPWPLLMKMHLEKWDNDSPYAFSPGRIYVISGPMYSPESRLWSFWGATDDESIRVHSDSPGLALATVALQLKEWTNARLQQKASG